MAALAFAYGSAPALAARPFHPVICAAAGGTASLPHLSLRQLIQLRLGDQQAYEAYIHEWLPVVETEAHRYALRGGAEADLAAEGALALWEAALQYDPQRHRTTPERYICNHIHRQVRRAYRKSQGFAGPKLVPVESLAEHARPDESFTAAEQRADMAQALRQLKPAEQMQFRRYLGLSLAGLGPDEAARTLAAEQQESFAACKKRIERLRRKMKTQLSRLG